MSSYTNPVPTPAAAAEPSSVVVESSEGTSGAAGSVAKRRRINFACNYCRNRKTRCDEQKPSCRACINAGIECVTTDRRRPGVEVQRRETKRRLSRASSASLTHSLTAVASPHSPREEVESSELPPPPPALPDTRTKTSPSIELLYSRDRTASVVATKLVTVPKDAAVTIIPEDEEPPACQAPPKYQGKLPVVRPSRGNNSVEILGDWLDLAARRLGIQQRRGMPTRIDRPPAYRILSSEPCPFPPKEIARELAARYLEGINLVYPLFTPDRLMRDIDTAVELGPINFAEARGLAALVSVYLVMSIAFASAALSEPTLDPGDYVIYCKTLIGHLVTVNGVETVRSLALLSLCLHCYDECAGAWNILTTAVSIATSLGLHKPRTCRGGKNNRPDKRPDFANDEERKAFWLGIFSFEKFLAFELGRLSSIEDEECYPPHVDMPMGNGTSSKDKAFAVTVDLARILSEIGRKAVIVSRKEDGLRDGALQAIIAEKVETTGEAQLLLTRWGESVPDELRPISDILIGSKQCPFASFISMHYNNALVILSRNSLLISEEAITSGANLIAKGKPWDYIMRNGQGLAANAARKVLRIVVEAVDSKSNAILPNLLAPLHALTTLAVHVVTHPDSRISTMDLHLIQTASDSMREIYTRLRGDGLLDMLLQKIDSFLHKGLPTPGSSGNRTTTTVPSMTPRSMPDASPWQNAGETPTPRSVDAQWSGSDDSRRRESGGNVPGSTMPFYNQGNGFPGGSEFGFDSFGEMPMVGDEWSPSLSDGIGWDWACFSHLLNDQYQPQ
ncbi:fungal specific transcription factor domain-containing protein [Colletotrichum scovillei]|uniref:Fungal specific transcription factor domain-containing protein n=1 Tax=Colletotrichum scovillei TaxID=1209932 RepID=A0A9P7R2Q0_9PEZI|nr:fungal specific transcription factor domain-containing protein [Colletotrichum scovillei]KAF4777176.1 fungal specific transcription factor domain-containing protein [Colletotrichum scovillei]KAG7047682.1 fungal specific transcription factor domain-containing protein [Colletotrichum scovillei]KAG7059994.1 fungal specific transcription factor domain-containing protein [Colletotrichum scovillei]KAG7067448.1 fungal specific transcription factor domain-containing protein [Colletotrichum scovillei